MHQCVVFLSYNCELRKGKQRFYTSRHIPSDLEQDAEGVKKKKPLQELFTKLIHFNRELNQKVSLC